jgi:hypothetical protein
MKYVFLPPYSPDFNPIELMFSTIKAYLRRHGNQFRVATECEQEKAAVLAELHEAVWSITKENAEGWFHHCSYL